MQRNRVTRGDPNLHEQQLHLASALSQSFGVLESGYPRRELGGRVISEQAKEGLGKVVDLAEFSVSHYICAPKDLPCAEKTLRLQVQVRRFFCDHATCQRKIDTIPFVME
jgi:hypothetical protein